MKSLWIAGDSDIGSTSRKSQRATRSSKVPARDPKHSGIRAWIQNDKHSSKSTGAPMKSSLSSRKSAVKPTHIEGNKEALITSRRSSAPPPPHSMLDRTHSLVSCLRLYTFISFISILTTSFTAVTLADGEDSSSQPVESANATSSSDPSCYEGVEFPLTVTSIVFMVLGLQLAIWSAWILIQRYKR